MLTPQEGEGAGDDFNLILNAVETNIQIYGDYLKNMSDPNLIPVVVYFIDGTWYDGNIVVEDGQNSKGYILLNYPKTQPPGVGRLFAALYLANGKMIYLGRAWKKADDPIKLKIAFNGDLEFRDPTPESGGYIPIDTTGELMLINRDADTLKGNYRQMRALDLLGVRQGMEAFRALNWEPLGRPNTPFTGIYAGNNKEIEHLYISRVGRDNAGLFGYIKVSPDGTGGRLENITVNSGSVQGSKRVGALCGYNDGGTISNGKNGSLVEGAGVTGGVAGYNLGTIKDSYNYGEVYAEDTVGGITGSNLGTISNCVNGDPIKTNTGGIGSMESKYAGGIAGVQQPNSRIENCKNYGAVSAQESAGGIAGSSQGTIEKSHNYSSKVTAYWNAGGVAGYNVARYNNEGDIESCTNEGAVTGLTGNTGGVCGMNLGGMIKASSNKGIVSGVSNVGGVAGFNAYSHRDAPKPEITACYNAGNIITGSDRVVGGVCGNNQGFITASYNTGSVSGGSIVGGVVGLNSAIHYSFANGVTVLTHGYYAATVSACYNTGAVTGNNMVGGISGQNNTEAHEFVEDHGIGTTAPAGNTLGYFEGLVKDSYWRPSPPPPRPLITAVDGIGYIPGQGPVLPPDENSGGCVQFGTWPVDEPLKNWGIGDDPDTGKFWKSLGTYPKLYWE